MAWLMDMVKGKNAFEDNDGRMFIEHRDIKENHKIQYLKFYFSSVIWVCQTAI